MQFKTLVILCLLLHIHTYVLGAPYLLNKIKYYVIRIYFSGLFTQYE